MSRDLGTVGFSVGNAGHLTAANVTCGDTARSQTVYEQAHIASALVFELSKVEHVHVREAIVGHLRHIEEDLAKRVAAGLVFDKIPDAAVITVPV